MVLVAVSRKGRAIMGRLERGDSLIDSLLQVCRKYSVRSAEIRGLGAFQEVELTAYDQVKSQYLPPHRFAGNLEILSLVGNVTEKDGDLFCHLHATVARDTDNGIQVLGGHVKQATVFACEFVLDTLDDVILRRKPDRRTGLYLWQDKIELRSDPNEGGGALDADASSQQTVTNKGAVNEDKVQAGGQRASSGKGASDVTWNDVLQATLDRKDDDLQGAAGIGDGSGKKTTKGRRKAKSEASSGDDVESDAASTVAAATVATADDEADEAAASDGEDDWIEPEVGDILMHPKFGRGLIERVEDSEFIHVRLKSNRSVRLSLDVIRLNLSGYEEGHQVFEASLVRE